MPLGRNRRPLALAAFTAGLLLLLALAPAAMGDALTPESGGSQNAEDIDTLYKIVLYVAIVIFVLVEGVLIWSLVKFRARRDGPRAQQIRGNTPLEIGWTLGAALILVVLTVVTFLYLDDIKNPPPSGPNGLQAAELGRAQYATIDQPNPPRSGGPYLTIGVNGQQYLWRFDYPGEPQLFSYYEMVVPTDTTVVLKIRASDVIHSWWIPRLGGKADAVPGHTNETWFKIEKAGTYKGQCAELCGANHADMRAVVRALPPEQYRSWAAQQRRSIAQAKELVGVQRRRLQEAGDL